MTSLYKLILEHTLLSDNQSETQSDIQSDLEHLQKVIYKLIDPSVRKYIQKRGISIIKNTYAGFDTEYKNIDDKTNKLLSVQIATSTKIIIKLPLTPSYKLSTVDTVTNKSYVKFYPSFDPNKETGFDFGRMEDLLRTLTHEIRELKYSGYDYSIATLIDGLKRTGLKSMSTTE